MPRLLCSLFLLAVSCAAACRDCAAGAWGGPADNRFTVFDTPAAAQPGAPRLYVNTATLNLYLHVTDLALGPSGEFTLERSFNLEDTRPGPFGEGWAFNLGESLTPDPDGRSWTLRRASGATETFAPALEAGRFFSLSGAPETLTRDPDGAFRLQVPGSAALRIFSPEGRLLSVDNGAFRTAFEYDAAGRLLRALALGRAIEFTYDDAGRLASAADSAGRTVLYTYTPEGRLASWTAADGRTVALQYDDRDLPAAIGPIALQYDPAARGLAALTLPGGTVRRYEAIRPRHVAVTDPAGNATVYGHDARGLTESVTDPAGNRTAFTYDAAGRRTRAVNPAGETTRFDYNAAGLLASVTDPAGNRWQADYDGAGRLIALADPNGHSWQLRYDPAGNLARVTDPLGNESSAVRDDLGRIVSITGPHGPRHTFAYDDAGLPVQATGALGGAWKYAYDAAGRVTTRTAPSGAAVTAQYDPHNRLTALAAGDARVSFDPHPTRDDLGRLVSHTDPYGNTVAYTWDRSGRLARIALPGGGEVAYDYDRAGRLARVADWQGNFALCRYDAAGSLASISVSGGPTTVFQYDAARNLRARITTGPDGRVISAWRYTRDAAGNRVASGALEPLPGPLAPGAAAMSYDAANRIASGPDGRTYHWDADARLTAADGPSPAALAWDPFGRLERFTAGDTEYVYRYGPEGLPIERTRAGETRRYLWDLSGPQPRLLAELDAANTPLAWYIHGLGLLWKLDPQGRPWFYHFDPGGNTAAVSSPSEGIVNRYRYDPLGRLAAADEAIENPFRARGEAGFLDQGNGLLYGGGAFHWPEARTALPAAVDIEPPGRTLLPRFTGPAACFIEGPASCGGSAR